MFKINQNQETAQLSEVPKIVQDRSGSSRKSTSNQQTSRSGGRTRRPLRVVRSG